MDKGVSPCQVEEDSEPNVKADTHVNGKKHLTKSFIQCTNYRTGLCSAEPQSRHSHDNDSEEQHKTNLFQQMG